MLNGLEPEVLASIIEFAIDTSPRTARSIALINKYINSVSKLVVHRHPTFHLTGTESLHELSKNTFEPWCEDSTLLGSIRSITISSDRGSFNPDEDQYQPEVVWKPFADLISKIGKLRCLTWNAREEIPLSVLRALETYQKQATLRMFNYTPPGEATEPTETTLALSRSPALTHLRASIPRHFAPHYIREQARDQLHVLKIVAEAPNLEHASIINWGLDMTRPEGAKVREYLPDFFPQKKKPSTSIRSLTLDGYDLNQRTLYDWSAMVDLSSLHSIKFSRGSLNPTYFAHATTMLPNLQHISLNFSQIPGNEREATRSAAYQYLTTCSPVKSLSLWSWMNVISLEDILAHHSDTLASLHLHMREGGNDNWPRKILSCKDLRLITEKCGNLRHLTFDLNRTSLDLKLDNTDANMEYFTILSEIGARLSSLQIFLDAGVAYKERRHTRQMSNSSDEDRGDKDEMNKPIAPTEDSVLSRYVQDIWKLVFKGNKAGKRLLTVKVGEWDTARGLPRIMTPVYGFYEDDLQRQFIVTPMERDDQNDQCSVKMMKKNGRGF